ncbi:hypothetical protein FGU71_01440 [Erythrobacter insulae]|uniref:Uncharacterized protein n=1 Tax=Erythrobacter insulae TaxID=2584124 RepID=A0A547P941_9SPHN|nr:hypothetical protein [Erythrobacter insulae]TRD10661.1 hypothetical protein FGU71_01440 [Erythrobacter insulae]
MSRQPVFALCVAVASIGFFTYQLNSCSVEPEPPLPPRTDPVPIVKPADIAETIADPVLDQLISCEDDQGAVSVLYDFLVLDGKVWRYDSFDNIANRDCTLANANCKMGWFEGRLAVIEVAPSRTYTYLVDLEKLEMDEVVDLNFSNMDLEPTLNPIVPCTSKKPPLGILVNSGP